MLRLMLMRHAKSDRPAGVADPDRPLNARGRDAAASMGRLLQSKFTIPELVLCSTARRTRETCTGVLAQWQAPVPVQWEEQLYLATDSAIISLVARTPAAHRSLLVIGHNPGVHDAAQNLLASGGRKQRSRLSENFPTAAVAIIDFETTAWPDIAAGDGHLVEFVTPKGIDRTD